mgnify:CR=1 FL=1
MIYQLIYRSRANIEVSPLILASIGDVAETRNAKLGITGLLCHSGGTFYQLIEGPRDSVELLMEKIAVDNRHSEIEVIQRREIANREFGDWAMAIVCDNDDVGEELTYRCFDSLSGAAGTSRSGFESRAAEFERHPD